MLLDGVSAADLIDLARIAALLPVVELGRRTRGPARLVPTLRACGRRVGLRTADRRARLRRLIRAVDARLPGGGNCYRRALLEMALDPQSAAEPLHLGLRAGGGPNSGHAWLGDDRDPGAAYDAEFVT